MGNPDIQIRYVSSTDYDHEALVKLAGADNGQEAQIGWIARLKKVALEDA